MTTLPDAGGADVRRILLMTATVTPPADARQLQRMDPALRLGDYAQALAYYLRSVEAGVVDRIVFADNSNSDLSTLRSLVAASPVADKVEFLGFDGLDHPAEWGRGYGELKLIGYTMAHSAFIAAAPRDAVVWKITGRYIVENLAPLVAKVRPEAVFFCHCRNRPLRWVEMFLMGWKKESYAAVFAGVLDVTKESELAMPAEQAFRLLVDERSLAMPIQRRLSEPPRLTGVRGYDNAAYERQTFKRLLRSVASRWMPWVWL